VCTVRAPASRSSDQAFGEGPPCRAVEEGYGVLLLLGLLLLWLGDTVCEWGCYSYWSPTSHQHWRVCSPANCYTSVTRHTTGTTRARKGRRSRECSGAVPAGRGRCEATESKRGAEHGTPLGVWCRALATHVRHCRCGSVRGGNWLPCDVVVLVLQCCVCCGQCLLVQDSWTLKR